MTVWKPFTNLCLVRLFIEVDLLGSIGIGVHSRAFMKVGGLSDGIGGGGKTTQGELMG